MVNWPLINSDGVGSVCVSFYIDVLGTNQVSLFVVGPHKSPSTSMTSQFHRVDKTD